MEVTFATGGRLIFSTSLRIFWYLPQKQDIHLVKATYNRQFIQRGKIQQTAHSEGENTIDRSLRGGQIQRFRTPTVPPHAKRIGVITMTPIQRTPMWLLGFKLACRIYISPNAKLFFFNFQLPPPSIFELILLLLYGPTFSLIRSITDYFNT